MKMTWQNRSRTGAGLNRPECVLATSSGNMFASDWTLGISRIGVDGSVKRAVDHDLIADGFLPNGIALLEDGSFLFANLGEAGGVWRAPKLGPPTPFAAEAGGRKLPPSNFVLVDGARTWITVSAATRGHKHFTSSENTGLIVLVEHGVARIVAEGLTWTNELRLSADGSRLYVNETFACRTTRFDVDASGNLSAPFHIAYPQGSFPDGMACDEEGGVWSVCVVSNRLIRLSPDGRWDIVLEDLIPEAFEEIARAHANDAMTRDMIVQSRGRHVSNLSSIAFGGADRKTMFFGSLTMDSITSLPAPVAGAAPAHWNWA